MGLVREEGGEERLDSGRPLSFLGSLHPCFQPRFLPLRGNSGPASVSPSKASLLPSSVCSQLTTQLLDPLLTHNYARQCNFPFTADAVPCPIFTISSFSCSFLLSFLELWNARLPVGSSFEKHKCVESSSAIVTVAEKQGQDGGLKNSEREFMTKRNTWDGKSNYFLSVLMENVLLCSLVKPTSI